MPRPSLSIDALPVLSRGKHRNPRRGACFMEFASFLAGERWSDRPSCTHPALASLARLVNDWTTDAGRSAIAPMIPSVIGLSAGTPTLELVLAIRSAAAAIPVASEERQRLLAVGLIRTLQRLDAVDPAAADVQRSTVIAALHQVPYAEKWARQQIRLVRSATTRSDTPMCDAVVAIAVAGIGEACIENRDERLRELLMRAIAETAAVQPAECAPTTESREALEPARA